MTKSPQPKTWRGVLPIHPAAELFPRMSEAELRELGEDIKKNGMTSPILLWPGDDGNYSLLDGRNRLDAMELVGLKTVDKNGKLAKELAPGSYGALGTASAEQIKAYRHLDPYNLVLSLNIHRRHLTAEQKRELIEKLLKAKPQSSDRTIAKQTKVDHKTVGKTRTRLEATGEIPQLKKTVGADGKSRSKPKKAKSEPGSVSAKDIALNDFTARALELVRLTRNQSARRFIETALPDESIRQLAKLFSDLINIRNEKVVDRICGSAEVSIEQRTAENAALDEAQ